MRSPLEKQLIALRYGAVVLGLVGFCLVTYNLLEQVIIIPSRPEGQPTPVAKPLDRSR